MTQITLQNITKSFLVPHQKRTTLKESFTEFWKKENLEMFTALQDISLQIQKGEFIGIIGPNGSGKSTLLKLLANIYSPNQGQIQVNGTVAPLLELGIGFQQDLSARDNIYLNATLLGLKTAKIHQILPQIVEFAEIGHFLDLKIKNYSSGMRQRLAFAIAMHLDADIYLCDEVFAVGDQSFQNKCLKVFEKWREQGKTIILVSHNINQIAELSDRVFFLQNGKLIAQGEPQEVVSTYQKIILHQEIFDFSNSPVRIKKLEMINQAGNSSNSFKTGEKMDLRIYFEAKEQVENPVFGIAIHRDDGTHITGPNTKTSGLNIPHIPKGEGFIQCTFPSINLLAGKYHFSVSIFNYTLTQAFDYLDKRFSFIVEENNANQYGIIDLSPIWRLP